MSQTARPGSADPPKFFDAAVSMPENHSQLLCLNFDLLKLLSCHCVAVLCSNFQCIKFLVS